MSAYWTGFWQGAAAAVGACLALSVTVAIVFGRQLRERDGVEP